MYTALTLFVLIPLFWASCSGVNYAIAKNHGMGYSFIGGCIMLGPLMTCFLFALMLFSDDFKQKRLIQQKRRDLKMFEEKIKEDETYTRYLE